MPKSQINTKSSSYQRDKESFLKDLRDFNHSKNIPYKIPTVNGIEIDLYHFYTLVQQRGGLSKVNQNDGWDSILRPLHLPHPCVNGSTLLKRIYSMYLEKYERAKGPPGRDDDNDLDEDPRRGSRGGMPRITFSGGTYISASGEALKTGPSRVAGPTERLTLSLLSPMPNEHDFAINVCTVLAADTSNKIPLFSCPHILDLLLAHGGVYNHSSLRDTIGRAYYECRGRYPDDFWALRAGGGGAKELADETKFMQPGIEQPELVVQALAAHNTLTDCLENPGADDDVLEKIRGEEDLLEDWVTEPTEEDQLFAPELTGGATDVYTQRVLQIASIMRSLSFHDENVHILAKNNTLIRFLLLCANCWNGALRQAGLDTLGNIATELIIKDPATCLISRHVLSTIQSSLVSPDRARVLAALELLNKLAQNEVNEDALLRSLEAKVYSDVCALLTLRDIMVLVCTLECVYALTSLGDRASEACARVPGLLHTLVSLLTVEAQSYGPKACILMRVVETVSGPSAIAAAEQQQQQQQQAQQQQQQTQQQQPQSQTLPKTSLEQSSSASASAPAPAPATPMSNIQQSHLQQRTVQENEHFALAWLRSSFEVLPPHDNSAVEVAEVYRQYLALCQKLGRKGVIAPAHFPRLVRTVFGGTIGPTTVTLDNGETRQAYIGIKTKPLMVKVASNGPASPILKAQLTNSSKPSVEVKPNVVTTQSTQAQQPQPSSAHPHLSQALESSPSNTSLIKHLLAHKVSPAPVAQVAQRQQNQQMRSSANVVTQPAASAVQAMEVDPEALIKCTTITPGGVASSTPVQEERVVISTPQETIKEENFQFQIDEQAQLTIKTAQNKMLADLLEKKSNPPVQVVQMGPQQMNAPPTIQITETGQIVQVKSDPGSLVQQINDSNVITQPAPYFQIKNEQGQIIHLKNEQGQIIQLKSEQLQPPLLSFKNEQGQIVQIKTEQVIQGGQVIQAGQMLQQGGQLIQQGGQLIQGGQVISQGGQLIQQGGQVISQGGQVISQGGQLIQQGGQVISQGGQLIQQGSQVISQGGQVISQGGQVISQGGQVISQGGQLIQQSVIQNVVKAEKEVVDAVNTDHSYTEPPNKKQKMEEKRESNSSPQESVSKTAANLYAALAASALEDEEDLIPPEQKPMEVVHPQQLLNDNAPANVIMQEPILQVQQPTMQVQQQTLQIQQPTLQVQAPTLQVQQPMLQVQPMDVQNIIASQPGQLILQDKPIMTQQTQFVQQPMQIIAAPGTSQGGLSYLTQNIPGNMMQKTIIIVQGPTGGGPLTLTVNNPGALDEATLNSLITQATEAITQQQIIQNSGVIQSAQRVIVSQAALVSTSQPITVVKTAIAQNSPQITPSQQPIITTQPQPHKAQIVNQSQAQQMLVTQKQPPALITTSGNQVVGSNQQIIQGNQQLIAVSNAQQMVVKAGTHRAVGQRQVVCVPNTNVSDGKSTVIQTSTAQRQVVCVKPSASKDGKTTVVQTTTKTQQQMVRQVISRQPVMVGNNKIGDKEIVVTQPAPVPVVVPEKPPTPKPTATPPPQLKAEPQPQPQPSTQAQPAQEETPWICHWRGCGKTFENAADVFTHAAKVHCPVGATGEAPCMWLDCDRVPRKTFALLNHLTDKHTQPAALKAVFNSRRHIVAESEPNKPLAVGYPPNAALAALNKHANETFNPRELMDENEGPVTKSIRLTAALILRNIVIYSNTGRRQLRSYESHMATIALSTVEASRTIAQVLYDMNNI